MIHDDIRYDELLYSLHPLQREMLQHILYCTLEGRYIWKPGEDLPQWDGVATATLKIALPPHLPPQLATL